MDRQRGLVESLERAAAKARNRLGSRAARFEVAGLSLRVRWAGAALRDTMLPAMAHAEIEATAPPDLDVSVWDSATSGVPLPVAAGRPADHTPHGLSRVRQRDDVLSFFDPLSCTLTALDVARWRAVHWIPNATDPPDSARPAPLQALMNWWLPARGRAVVHGSGVGTAAGGVLLLGSSDSGKSTTALACVEAGFSYLGDDLCAVTLDPRPTLHSVYCSAKILDADLGRFARFADHVVNPDRRMPQKAIAYLNGWGPDIVRRQLPLRAAVVLAGRGRPAPELERLTPGKALLAVAPGIFLNFPGHDKLELAALAKLVTRVPCYRMELAADLRANPEALRRLLTTMGT
jgi:hypothetical protein